MSMTKRRPFKLSDSSPAFAFSTAHRHHDDCRARDPIRTPGTARIDREVWRLRAMGNDDLLDRFFDLVFIARGVCRVAPRRHRHFGRILPALSPAWTGCLPAT